MDTCVFCKIVAKQIPASIVYEDEHTIVFMDIGSVNPGHMLVACKPHVENVFGLDDALAAAVMRTTARAARALRTADSTFIRLRTIPGSASSAATLRLR